MVIHPPVDVEKFYTSPTVDDYYLVCSRFAPYKRVDLVIEAFNQLGWRLLVVGSGEQKDYLNRISGPTIEFSGYLSDSELIDRLSRCRGLVHAAEEDFGINMVESIASGRPVVAYWRGGATDIVQPNLNGVLFREPTVESLVEALKQCNAQSWDTHLIRETSLRFGKLRFKQEFESFIDWALADFRNTMPHPVSIHSSTRLNPPGL